MRKKGQQRLDQFWASWQNEYRLSLRESLHSQRKQRRTAIDITPSINHIVHKNDTPHGIWRFARITEVHISYNGQVLAVSVKTFLPLIISRAEPKQDSPITPIKHNVSSQTECCCNPWVTVSRCAHGCIIHRNCVFISLIVFYCPITLKESIITWQLRHLFLSCFWVRRHTFINFVI